MSGQQSGGKPRITHLALKVEDPDQAAKVFKEVFGFEETDRRVSDGGSHISLHLSDGTIDLALLTFKSEDGNLAALAGEEPCIHHFGIDVDNPQAYAKSLAQEGVELIDDPENPGTKTIKFRVPGGGGIGEISPPGWHERQLKNA